MSGKRRGLISFNDWGTITYWKGLRMYISLPAIPTDATEALAAISLVNERLKAKAPVGVSCPMAEVAEITEYVCQALAIILADGKQHYQTKIMRIRETLSLLIMLKGASGLTFM